MKRRLVCLTLAAASFMALVGCTNTPAASSPTPSTEPTPSSSDSRKVLSVTIDSSETTVNVAESITLTASVEVEGGASKLVTWSIESGGEFATIGADTGKLEGKDAGTVVVKATSVFDETKFATKTIEVKDGFNKISEVTQAGTYNIRGVIVALNAKGFLVSDKTGTTLVYLNRVPSEYQVGDYVSVSETLVKGDYQPSNGLWEFTKDATVKKLDAAAPTIDTSATPLTKEIADGWKSVTAVDPAKDIKKYSWTATCGVSGNFFTLNYAESDTVVEPFYSGSDITFEKGHVYNLEGYFINYATKYSYAAVLFTKAEDTTKVSVTATKTALNKGETAQVTATSRDAEDKTFTYASSAPKIASVSDTGLVTALAQGETTITVKGSHSGDEATIKFTITDPSLTTAKIDYQSYKTTDLISFSKAALDDAEHKEFGLDKKTSVKNTKKVSNIVSLALDIFGSYQNQKVYVGSDNTGTLVTPKATNGTNGKLYTYTFDEPVDNVFIENPSTYKIWFFSITFVYSAAE